MKTYCRVAFAHIDNCVVSFKDGRNLDYSLKGFVSELVSFHSIFDPHDFLLKLTLMRNFFVKF